MYCTGCHSSFPLNGGNGTLSLIGLPDRYTPGRTYLLAVRIADNYQKRWGFELTVIRPGEGTEGGTLTITDDRNTWISEGEGIERDYVKQSYDGTFAGADSARWHLDWTAPPAGSGPVRFYLAGNAANNNEATSNDYIYGLDRLVDEGLDPASIASGPAFTTGAVDLRCYPEPAGSAASLEVCLPSAGPLRIRVVDATGRVVRTLAAPDPAESTHRLEWKLRDESGEPLPRGVYFYTVESSHGVATRRFTVSSPR
jgi:hypothetical protein